MQGDEFPRLRPLQACGRSQGHHSSEKLCEQGLCDASESHLAVVLALLLIELTCKTLCARACAQMFCQMAIRNVPLPLPTAAANWFGMPAPAFLLGGSVLPREP